MTQFRSVRVRRVVGRGRHARNDGGRSHGNFRHVLIVFGLVMMIGGPLTYRYNTARGHEEVTEGTVTNIVVTTKEVVDDEGNREVRSSTLATIRFVTERGEVVEFATSGSDLSESSTPQVAYDASRPGEARVLRPLVSRIGLGATAAALPVFALGVWLTLRQRRQRSQRSQHVQLSSGWSAGPASPTPAAYFGSAADAFVAPSTTPAPPAAPSPAPTGVPAGWFDDPHDASLMRWWDGATWTEHTRAATR